MIVLVQQHADPLSPDLSRLATALAQKFGYVLDTRVPEADSPMDQARAVADAVARHPRAIVIDATEYEALLPYLRAAHDVAVPVVIIGPPRDVANPAFVISFVTVGEATEAAELNRTLSAGSDVVVIASKSAIGAARFGMRLLTRALQRIRPAAAIESVAVGDRQGMVTASELTAVFGRQRAGTSIVLADSRLAQVAAATTGRTDQMSVASASGTVLSLVASGKVGRAVGARSCLLLRAAMRQAIAAALGIAADVLPTVELPAATATTATVRRTGLAAWSGC